MLHGGRGLFQAGGLGLRALAQGLVVLRQAMCAFVHGERACAHLAEYARELCVHGCQRAQQLAQFVVQASVKGLAERSGGNALRNFGGQFQPMHQGAHQCAV